MWHATYAWLGQNWAFAKWGKHGITFAIFLIGVKITIFTNLEGEK